MKWKNPDENALIDQNFPEEETKNSFSRFGLLLKDKSGGEPENSPESII